MSVALVVEQSDTYIRDYTQTDIIPFTVSAAKHIPQEVRMEMLIVLNGKIAVLELHTLVV